jgi:predicted metal-binding membrane protein
LTYPSSRLISAIALSMIAALCWWYLFNMDMMSMMILGQWTPGNWIDMFLMWAIMMVGMMLPSALPMILMFQLISPRRQASLNAALCTALFTLGYVLAWTAFSVLATVLQWWLQQGALLTPMLEPKSVPLSSAILIAAGLYQWLPIKNSCLANCRAPVEYLSLNWRPGTRGSLYMGLAHGAYCLGCCWVLMLLLFAGGVMNLLLVGTITVFVLLEKVLPGHRALTGASGAALVTAGAYLYVAQAS